MKKFIHILGARPNFIKASPVIKVLESKGFLNVIIHTNQHYDYLMSSIFFKQLSIQKPDYNLGIKSGTHGFQTGTGIIKIEEVLLIEKPDFVVVYGDVNSSLSGAIAAVKLNIPIVHIESGCRSFDNSMPEEINRKLIDRVSTFLSCTEKSALDNLSVEGLIGNNIINSGNTAIDAIYNFDFRDSSGQNEDYYIATFHRVSNVDDSTRFNKILNNLNSLEKLVYFPTHPRIKEKINTKAYQNIKFMDPLGYLEFLNLIRNSKGGISDSGGIQCEYGFFKKKLLTVRNTTEHLITLKYNNKLIDVDGISEASFNSINTNYDLPFEWDGKASKRVVEQLIKYFKL